MNKRQLIKDVLLLNLPKLILRFHKFTALLKRQLVLPANNYSATKRYYDIPIIINNRNRHTCLRLMIDWLMSAGYKNIVVLDNNSRYKPLLDYYKNSPVKVIYLKENMGHLAFWKTPVYREYYRDYYVYTDPDILPVAECPADFMSHFMALLNKNPNVEKVGFGLKIDDLPDTYDRKNEVIYWENQFWQKEIETGVYDARIDTTFALYKPFTNAALWPQNALRTGGNYVARHLPWYEDSRNETEESRFYRAEVKEGASHWIRKDV
ncbi:MAG: glycosyltransferase family 2 protein [bacterium]